MKNMPRVTVCILTYNPNYEELLETLRSVALQDYPGLQIVVSDDGSTNTYFDEAKQYLDSIGFSDYVFLAAMENQGTVRNVYKAVQAADGDYIKTISPGDSFIDNTILRRWVAHLQENGREWSFGEAVYYVRQPDGTASICQKAAHPQLLKVYQKRKDSACRWNYTVLDDIAMGAAILCRRERLLEYVQKIAGHVIYAEDNVYRMMMFDGIVGSYVPESTILYECAGGISSSGKVIWTKRLRDDWEEADRIMLENADLRDPLQAQMAKKIRSRYQCADMERKLRKLTERGRLRLELKRWLCMRLTGQE